MSIFYIIGYDCYIFVNIILFELCTHNICNLMDREEFKTINKFRKPFDEVIVIYYTE